MKVFDFDNTIYDGECSLDFFMYCIKKKKSLIKYLPIVAAKAIKYKNGIVSSSEVIELGELMLKVFFDNCENLEDIVNDFWAKHIYKLKPKILDLISSEDAIISASPSFLFEDIKSQLKTSNILCTQIDIKNKKLLFLCYSENKVKAFKEKFGESSIDEFYTDNINDAPLMSISKKIYIVNKNKITDINYKKNRCL